MVIITIEWCSLFAHVEGRDILFDICEYMTGGVFDLGVLGVPSTSSSTLSDILTLLLVYAMIMAFTSARVKTKSLRTYEDPTEVLLHSC